MPADFASMSAIVTVTFVVAIWLTRTILKLAAARGMLDVPNERSSHEVPTPRGGGLAIVAATLGAVAVFFMRESVDLDLLLALGGGGALVAIVGFLDDRKSVRASLRFVAHLLAAGWAMYWLGGLPDVRIGHDLYTFGSFGYVLGAIGIVWALNLFNFMDGIDGIAGSEAGFVASGAVVMMGVSGLSVPEVAGPALALAAASCGFLWWNWPPARIFMGDAGSGFIGFSIAVLAIAHARADPTALFLWAILGAAFIADSGVTLLRRLARREKLSQAHRSHAYQHLARRWRSHRRVTLLTLALGVSWLLPWALIASLRPHLAAVCALVAFIPVVVGVAAAGAGRRDVS